METLIRCHILWNLILVYTVYLDMSVQIIKVLFELQFYCPVNPLLGSCQAGNTKLNVKFGLEVIKLFGVQLTFR